MIRSAMITLLIFASIAFSGCASTQTPTVIKTRPVMTQESREIKKLEWEIKRLEIKLEESEKQKKIFQDSYYNILKQYEDCKKKR